MVAESYGAYVPDLPGCVAVGETQEEARRVTRRGCPAHNADVHLRQSLTKDPLILGGLSPIMRPRGIDGTMRAGACQSKYDRPEHIGDGLGN